MPEGLNVIGTLACEERDERTDSLREWAISRLASELEKGEGQSEADWIPEEEILREFNVTL